MRPTATLLVLTAIVAPSVGQEAINTDAAVQPSTGKFLLREQMSIRRAHRDRFAGQEDVTEWVATTSINYGLTYGLAASISFPLRFRTGDTLAGRRGVDEEIDQGDIGMRLKWRVLQVDPGPLQTDRLSVIGGLEFDTGDAAPSLDPGFAGGSTNPTLGFAYTRIRDRWGFGGAGEWEFDTSGGPDSARLDAAVLFRFSPAVFRAGDTGAWYGLLESNTRHASNGDIETFLSPGLMYEGQAWTYEASLMLPIARDLDHRAAVDATIVFGIRLLF